MVGINKQVPWLLQRQNAQSISKMTAKQISNAQTPERQRWNHLIKQLENYMQKAKKYEQEIYNLNAKAKKVAKKATKKSKKEKILTLKDEFNDIDNRDIKPESKKRLKRQIKNIATKNITETLNQFELNSKKEIVHKVLKKDTALGDDIKQDFLEQFKEEHNKAMGKLDRDNGVAFKNYLICAATNSQTGYNVMHQQNKYTYDPKTKKKTLKTTKAGFRAGTSTTDKRGQQMFKKYLLHLKKQEMDMFTAIIFIEQNELQIYEYETSKEGKQIIRDLKIKDTEYVYCDLRRNPYKFIYLKTIANPEFGAGPEVQKIEPNFTMDGVTTGGNYRGRDMLQVCFRIPIFEKKQGVDQNLYPIARFFCKENNEIFKRVFHIYFSKIVETMEKEPYGFVKYQSM